MSTTLHASIVIPTHNKRKDVVRCIESLLSQDFSDKSYEIIVVDDGSKDDTPQVLPYLNTGDIPFTYRRLEGKGPACARNDGIRHAKAPIVVFIDDDAIPQPGYLEAIYAPFADDTIVGVEGKVVPVEGAEMGLLGMSPRNLEGGVYLTCNIAFRRAVLEAVGGLDESFPFPAFEDTDLVAAIEPYGKIVWEPNAEVWHPRRRWSLKRAIREIKFNEPLVVFTRRYGYLGWKDRPTRYAALRIYLSAVLLLPAGRVLRGIKGIFTTQPLQAMEYTAISFLQGVAASILVIPPIIKGLKADPIRKKYL